MYGGRIDHEGFNLDHEGFQSRSSTQGFNGHVRYIVMIRYRFIVGPLIILTTILVKGWNNNHLSTSQDKSW